MQEQQQQHRFVICHFPASLVGPSSTMLTGGYLLRFLPFGSRCEQRSMAALVNLCRERKRSTWEATKK